jgi:hypothetical protein
MAISNYVATRSRNGVWINPSSQGFKDSTFTDAISI